MKAVNLGPDELAIVVLPPALRLLKIAGDLR